MIYDYWITKIPEELKKDSVWIMESYRQALYLADLCWDDSAKIMNLNYAALGNSLYDTVCTISSEMIEAETLNSNIEKARYFERALISARKAKDGYFKSRHILGSGTAFKRIHILSGVIHELQDLVKEQKETAYQKGISSCS